MNVHTRYAPLSALVGLTMILTACSSDPDPATEMGDTTPDAPAATNDDVTPAPSVSEPSVDAENEAGDDAGAGSVEAGTVRGTATVDGVEYELHDLRRCEPLEDDQIERELELTARGVLPAGEGYDGEDWVQLDVYVESIAGMPFDSVSWAGPEGVFGTNEATEVDYGEDRVSGTAVMVDSLTQEDTLEITYDVEVPDEFVDCRL